MDASVASRLRAAVLPAALVVLLLLTLLALGRRYCAHPAAFNSDNLFAVEFCETVLGDGGELRHYHLPCAPYVFPDMVLCLAAVALSRELLVVFLTYDILYYGLTLATLTALLRQTGLRLREAFLFSGSGLLLLLVSHLDAPYAERALQLFHPGNHAGAILVGLFLTLLVVRNLHRPVPLPSAAVFLVAGGLSLFSDRLLLPQFFAPLCFSAGVLAAFRVVPVRKAVETALLAGGAYAASLGLQRAFAHYFVLLPLSSTVDLTQIAASWRGFRDALPVYLEGQFVLKLTCLAFVPVATVVALRALWSARTAAADEPRRARTALTAVALVGLLCVACNLTAVILSGTCRLQGFDRYLLGAVFMPFLFLAVCIRFLPGWPFRWFGRALPALVVLLAAAEVGLRHRQALSFDGLRPAYSEAARVLDRLAREKKISCGLATYWNARSLAYLTRERIPLRAILPDGEPWLHSTSPGAFLAPEWRCLALPHYDFILFDGHNPDPNFRMDRADLERRFGSPRETVPAGSFEVWIYDGLLASDFNLFLRSTLAPRCRRARPWVGPASPAALAVPKENGTGPLRPGTVRLAPGGEVVLTFAGPVKGELLDLGAPFDAHFDLRFYRGDELLATLYAPRVNVPMMSSPYRTTGNQSRLLTLPPALRGQEWTNVVVRARGGPGPFALGHFLVYARTPPGLRTRQTPVGGRWRFEAESQPGEVPGSGAVVPDPQASGGQARFAPRDFSGAMVCGPYAFLEGGRYRVEFFVKASPAGEGSPVARLEVTSGGAAQPHAHRDLFAADFAGTDGYRKFTLTLETEVELSDCQFRVLGCGKAPLYVDRIELVCEE
jgi:hypothetical protein